MSTIGEILEAAKNFLQASVPTRVVTRELKDFGDRPKADLKKGIYTLISRGQERTGPGNDYVLALLVGQIELAEKSTSVEIEEAELTMVDEVRAFCDRIQGMQISPRRVYQSQQLEAPYGWVGFELEFGPFDLSIPLDLALLDNFTTYHAEHTVADGTVPKPVATDQVTLPA